MLRLVCYLTKEEDKFRAADVVEIYGEPASIWQTWYMYSQSYKHVYVYSAVGALIDCKKGIQECYANHYTEARSS